MNQKVELDSAILRSKTCKYIIYILNKVYLSMQNQEGKSYKDEVEYINKQKYKAVFRHKSTKVK